MKIYLRNGNLRKGKKTHYVAVVRERSEGKKLWLQEQRRRKGESSWVGSWQLDKVNHQNRWLFCL